MIFNKWNERVEVVGRVNHKMSRVVFHNECRESYDVYTSGLKNGCELKNRKTRSVYRTGYLDYDKNTGTYEHTSKERQLWKGIMRKYSEKGITYKPYCSFVEFVKALRKNKAYDAIINDDKTVVMGIGSMGEIFLSTRRSHTSEKVKRINTRTGRVIVFESLEACALAMNVTKDYLRKIVGKGKKCKGCLLEYLDD